MPFFMSVGMRYGVTNALLNMGVKPETAFSVANAAAMIGGYHGHIAFSQEELLSVAKVTSGTHSEAFSEAIHQATTDSDILVNEMENIIAAVEKKADFALDDLDSNKTKEIFSQIDLAQVRINKDQEEIQSLVYETDELLNKLEYKVI